MVAKRARRRRAEIQRHPEEIRAQGTTVLMVEQNAYAAFELCDRCQLLESGEMTLAGTGQELRDNPHVKEAYLGG